MRKSAIVVALLCFSTLLAGCENSSQSAGTPEENTYSAETTTLELETDVATSETEAITSETVESETEAVTSETEAMESDIEATTSEIETATLETEISSDDVTNELEVYINVKAETTGESTKFLIETNLPDETVLMVSLRRGDYNTDDNFTAQDKTTILNGKAESAAFSNKGVALTGEYDLSISMSLPSLQADSVREIIGQNGENMVGPIVEDSSIGSSKVVSALFTFSANDGSITPVDDYNNTVFRDE